MGRDTENEALRTSPSLFSANTNLDGIAKSPGDVFNTVTTDTSGTCVTECLNRASYNYITGLGTLEASPLIAALPAR